MRDVICNRVIMVCRHQFAVCTIMVCMSVDGLVSARAAEWGF